MFLMIQVAGKTLYTHMTYFNVMLLFLVIDLLLPFRVKLICWLAVGSYWLSSTVLHQAQNKKQNLQLCFALSQRFSSLLLCFRCSLHPPFVIKHSPTREVGRGGEGREWKRDKGVIRTFHTHLFLILKLITLDRVDRGVRKHSTGRSIGNM